MTARDKRPIWAILGALVFAVTGAITARIFIKRLPTAKYIFINETDDHRFDESIRLSIFAAHERTAVQNAVVIKNCHVDGSTGGQSLEQQAANLFKSLDVGHDFAGRGILYLFCPQQHALKIEIGYALEAVLPDAAVHGLERAAKSFTFSNRYQDFWAELINTLNIEIYDHEHPDGGTGTEPSYDFSGFHFLSGGAGAAAQDYRTDLKQLEEEMKRPNNRADKPMELAHSPRALLAIYLASLASGREDDTAAFLTPESRLFRNSTPQTSYQLYRNGRMYAKAGIDQVFEEGRFAFAFFKSGHPVLPIVMRKDLDVWRVHEPLSWSLFQRFENSMNVYLKYPLSGISPVLAQYLRTAVGSPLYPLENPLKVDNLERKEYLQGDVSSLYFQLYDLDRVHAEISRLGLGSLPTDVQWIAVDTYLNLGRVSEFIEAYGVVARKFPQNEMVQRNAKFYREQLTFKPEEWRLH